MILMNCILEEKIYKLNDSQKQKQQQKTGKIF